MSGLSNGPTDFPVHHYRGYALLVFANHTVIRSRYDGIYVSDAPTEEEAKAKIDKWLDDEKGVESKLR
jgi:hypothetical protein